MRMADLHVHSRCSRNTGEWLLRTFSAAECYTEPEEVYLSAKKNGMQLVTITDHDAIEGSLMLRERHPDDTFTGTEINAVFPESGCTVHVLVYGLNAAEFETIRRLRTDIYDLRAYLKERNLACSVAHALYSEDGKLTLEELEKLILLFDVFECRNGGRGRLHNDTLFRALSGLTPGRIGDLFRRHRIEPFSADPWVKGFTGGSDDHAGLFIGDTWTSAPAESADGFLQCLRDRKGVMGGRHNDFRSLAFTVYKVVYDLSRSKEPAARSFTARLSKLIFNAVELSLTERLALWWLRARYRLRPGPLGAFIRAAASRSAGLPRKLELLYDLLAAFVDRGMLAFIGSLRRDISRGDAGALLSAAVASFRAFLLAFPFLGAVFHLGKNRALAAELEARFPGPVAAGDRTILWFTDTLGELNGVATMLDAIARHARRRGVHLSIVTALPGGTAHAHLPSPVINLPSIHTFALPEYRDYRLGIPSLLPSLREVYDRDPDRIFISTPGPVGALGLLAARCAGIPAAGVYHTDFYLQARDIAGEDAASMLESYVRWFYGRMDEIHVPTRAYMRILGQRGMDSSKFRLFRGGVDIDEFAFRPEGRDWLRSRFGVGRGVNLLFAGRVSRDKNLDFLATVHRELSRRVPGVNFIIAGDGPYREELQGRLRGNSRVRFTGRLDGPRLSLAYSGADLLVFPSVTDTCGLVVLEAQACRLPACVSDRGGPQELVMNGRTGMIAAAGSVSDWRERLETAILRMRRNPSAHAAMRDAARAQACESSWDEVVKGIVTPGYSSSEEQ